VKLTFVRLLVDDYPACFRFYRAVMGFPVTFGEGGYADFDYAAIEELRSRGAPVSAEPADREDWGIRVGYIRDPDGNLIELNHAMEAA
jgi:catechol 2,3-dioxygenase-like lactoylglutathione lyase family enzyme